MPTLVPEYKDLNYGNAAFKELRHGCLLPFVQNTSYASLFAIKLEKLPVSDKITVLRQKNVCQASYQSLQTAITKQVCKNHNLYPIHFSGLSICSSFCSVALSLIPSTFLSSYFSLMFLSIWWRYPTFEFW